MTIVFISDSDQSKVTNFDVSFVDKDVSWFQISMDNFLIMQIRKTFEQLRENQIDKTIFQVDLGIKKIKVKRLTWTVLHLNEDIDLLFTVNSDVFILVEHLRKIILWVAIVVHFRDFIG